MDTSVEYLLHLWFHLHSRWTGAQYIDGLVDSVILYAHIGTGSAGGSHLRRECQVASAASLERWCAWLRVSQHK